MSGPVGGYALVVGDIVNDVVVVPHEDVTTDSDTRARVAARPGGSAANTAAWLGSLGRPTTFVGRVGRADAAAHAGALAACGVQPALAVDDARETAAIVVLVGGRGAPRARTMYVDRGANTGLTASDVPSGAVEGAAVLHLTGYTFFDPPLRAACREWMDRAAAAGVPVSLDPSSVAFLRNSGAPAFSEWTAGAHLLFPNRDEALFLTGRADLADAARALGERHRVVVVTDGAAGALVVADGADPVRVPAVPAHQRDPTGAGDAFAAGFLHTWLDTGEPVAAAAAGCAVAARAVTGLGGWPAAAS